MGSHSDGIVWPSYWRLQSQCQSVKVRTSDFFSLSSASTVIYVNLCNRKRRPLVVFLESAEGAEGAESAEDEDCNSFESVNFVEGKTERGRPKRRMGTSYEGTRDE